MVSANRIIIDRDPEDFICLSCNRSFPYEYSLLQHCGDADVHEGEWCDRCVWLFVSRQACEAHNKARKHWFCSICLTAWATEEELMEDWEHTHSCCYDCDRYFHDWTQHRVKHHHRCIQCDEEFANDKERKMHTQQQHSKTTQKHVPPARNKECYGCYSKFTTDAAILQHLESGGCPSELDWEDIDRFAQKHYRKSCSPKNSNKPWYKSHLHHFIDLEAQDIRYRCHPCEKKYDYLSELMQHVETSKCQVGNSNWYSGLIGYIKQRVISG